MRVALLLSLLVLAGCGSDTDEPQAGSTAAPSAGAPMPGGGLSIEEALASDLHGPLMVRGYLIDRDGELRLCEAILESSPPQCGEPSLRVEGPAPAASEERVSLLGEVDGETITVSETATG